MPKGDWSEAYANTNRLHKVLDATVTAGDAKSRGFNGLLSTADNSMTYDANGNLIKNLHKNVSSIGYNHLNLPTVITFTTGNTIEFLYDAGGSKLRKTVKVSGVVQYVQDYIDGIEYRQTGAGVKRIESIFHAEGRYYNTNVDVSNTVAWRKEYNFKDHLGNTRLVFTDRNGNGVVDITGTASTSDVLQENHYYAFGMAFEGAWLQNDGSIRDNKYQYNGKELNDDFGLNWNDYGARWYDAAIGRWNAVDPMAEKYMSLSSYSYVSNNPIIFIDPNGKEIAIRFNYKDDGKNKEETVIYRDGKLYNRSGKEYTSGAGFNKKGNLTGFLRDAKNSLDKIRTTDKGLEMINSLQKGSYKDGGTSVLITDGSNNASVRAAGAGKLVEIGWNRQGGAQMLTDDGKMESAPEEIGLAHELAHAWDHQQGTFENAKIDVIDGKPILAAEYFATYIENRIREGLNYPLRTFYSSEQDTDSNGTPLSTFSGKIRVYDPTSQLHIKSSENGTIQYYLYKFKEK